MLVLTGVAMAFGFAVLVQGLTGPVRTARSGRPDDARPWTPGPRSWTSVSQVVTPVWDDAAPVHPAAAARPAGAGPSPWLAWAWHRNAALNRHACRAPAGRARAPEGVHLPPGSIWPFVAPIGLFLVFLALALGGGEGRAPVNLALASVGLLVFLVGGRRLVPRREPGVRRSSTRTTTGSSWPAQSERHAAGTGAIPEGVHLPGPSAWPFLAPIGLVVHVPGARARPAAHRGWRVHGHRRGVRLVHRRQPGVRAGGGDRTPRGARHPRSGQGVPEVGCAHVRGGGRAGHADRRCFPWFLASSRNRPRRRERGPPPTTTPFLSASTATNFDQGRIVIPADTPVTLTFQNDQAGVPHDVAIATTPTRTRGCSTARTSRASRPSIYQLPPFAAGRTRSTAPSTRRWWARSSSGRRRRHASRERSHAPPAGDRPGTSPIGGSIAAGCWSSLWRARPVARP